MTEISLSFKILWLVPNVKPMSGLTLLLCCCPCLKVNSGHLFYLRWVFFFFPFSTERLFWLWGHDSHYLFARMRPEGGNYRHSTPSPPQCLCVKKVPDFHSFNTPSSTITKCSPPSPRKSGARRKGLIAHRVRYIRTSCRQNPTSVALIRHLSLHPLCRRHRLFVGTVVSSSGSLISKCTVWPF